jgi:prepilin-type N-terminal cleavage/methylation domain-containing protein
LKKAFTLIELLVVIAIIAILAAILFPVFAQAKEAAKKTATLSQYKQVGTSSAIYLADNDDTFPLAFAFNTTTNTWRWGSYAATPTGWTTAGNRHLAPRINEEQSYVLNSLQPYIKNLNMYEANGATTISLTTPVVAGFRPPRMNLSFNGMLHSWSATAVNQPSRLPLFWPGMMKQNIEGLSLSQPMLDCFTAGTTACRFNPSGGPQGGNPTYGYSWFLVGQAANFSLWLYGRGMPFVSADTSARFLQFNAPNWPNVANNINSSPWSSFDPAGPPGSPYWMTDCVAPGGTKGATYYPGYFRPDSEFNYNPVTECDHGLG